MIEFFKNLLAGFILILILAFCAAIGMGLATLVISYPIIALCIFIIVIIWMIGYIIRH